MGVDGLLPVNARHAARQHAYRRSVSYVGERFACRHHIATAGQGLKTHSDAVRRGL